LAEIGTPKSTKLLVDIFLDKAVAYEGREADMFGFLITVCGEKGGALPRKGPRWKQEKDGKRPCQMH